MVGSLSKTCINSSTWQSAADLPCLCAMKMHYCNCLTKTIVGLARYYWQTGLAWRSATQTLSSWLIYNPSIHLLEANIPANITYSQCPTSNSDNYITSAILPLSYCYLVKALDWTATNTLHRSRHYASLSEYTSNCHDCVINLESALSFMWKIAPQLVENYGYT